VQEGAEKVPFEGIFFAPLSPCFLFPAVSRRGRVNKNIVFMVAAKPPPQKQFFFYPFPPARRDCPHFLSSLRQGRGGLKRGFAVGGFAARRKTPSSPSPE